MMMPFFYRSTKKKKCWAGLVPINSSNSPQGCGAPPLFFGTCCLVLCTRSLSLPFALSLSLSHKHTLTHTHAHTHTLVAYNSFETFALLCLSSLYSKKNNDLLFSSSTCNLSVWVNVVIGPSFMSLLQSTYLSHLQIYSSFILLCHLS